MTRNDPTAAIHMQIMWNRLIAVVEEQAQTLIHTAFSTAADVDTGAVWSSIAHRMSMRWCAAAFSTPRRSDLIGRTVGAGLDQL